MNCTRESEILEAVTAGRPCSEELLAHAADCADCTDLLVVSSALVADMQEAMHAADIPPSGVVWWRAQRRARAESIRSASRTIALVQTASVIAAAAGALALLGTLHWRPWLARFSDADYVIAAILTQWSVPLLIAIGASLALAPLALYLAVARD